jgi:cation diffusion facilitator family transporter
VGICTAAAGRLLHPRPLEHVGVGLAVSVAASLVNLAVSTVLLKASREHHSITLEADAKHLLTDVWTSAGVVVGVGLVALTGWGPLDPICAILVAVNIVKTGTGVVRDSVHGLMDAAVPAGERAAIEKALAPHLRDDVQVHALKTRRAGARRFVTLHVLVPGAWTVQRGHDLCEELEAAIREAVPFTHVTTHLEPVEDPVSWEDLGLDREGKPRG